MVGTQYKQTALRMLDMVSRKFCVHTDYERKKIIEFRKYDEFMDTRKE